MGTSHPHPICLCRFEWTRCYVCMSMWTRDNPPQPKVPVATGERNCLRCAWPAQRRKAHLPLVPEVEVAVGIRLERQVQQLYPGLQNRNTAKTADGAYCSCCSKKRRNGQEDNSAANGGKSNTMQLWTWASLKHPGRSEAGWKKKAGPPLWLDPPGSWVPLDQRFHTAESSVAKYALCSVDVARYTLEGTVCNVHFAMHTWWWGGGTPSRAAPAGTASGPTAAATASPPPPAAASAGSAAAPAASGQSPAVRRGVWTNTVGSWTRRGS